MKYVLCLMLLLSSQIAWTQPSCYSKYPSYYTSLTLPTALPPLNSGMLFDELIAHIVIDSVCRTLVSTQIDSFMQARTGWDDTLKAMMKYMTVAVDNDPLNVFGITNATSEWRLSFPIDIRNALARSVNKYSPSKGLDIPIASCDYIMKVSVQDTTTVLDTSAKIAKTARVSTAAISQVILGHNYPPCVTEMFVASPATAVDCITFDTRKENISYTRDELGLPSDDPTVLAIMPKPGREYLVFLKLTKLCSASGSVYFTVNPAYWVGSHCGVYEITGGKIVDTLNYFGLGTNPLAQDVVSALSNRIQSIKTWVP